MLKINNFYKTLQSTTEDDCFKKTESLKFISLQSVSDIRYNLNIAKTFASEKYSIIKKK